VYIEDPITIELIDKYEDIELERKLNYRYSKCNPNVIEATKRWQKKNPEKVRKTQNKYKRNRARIDPKYNLNRRMGCMIWQSLKGNKKGRHWETLVGYTLNDLTKHLKNTVPKEYTWQDYLKGKFHIDHIKPISAFNFIKPEDEEFKQCWALDNLQLLLAEDNLRKGKKL